MISFDVENITKGIGIVTATLAMLGGGYTLLDKISSKQILEWAPEHFSVSDGDAYGTFDVIVAREKFRMIVQLKDSDLKLKIVSIMFTLQFRVLLNLVGRLVIK